MEYCGGGSLSDLMKLVNNTFTEEQIAVICKYVIQGLAFLHENGRIHRDIKGSPPLFILL